MLTSPRPRCGWAVCVTLPAGLLCSGWELSVLCLYTWSCLSLQSHPQLPPQPPPPAPPQCWAPRGPLCLRLWPLLQPPPPPPPRASHVSLSGLKPLRQVCPWGSKGAAWLLLLPVGAGAAAPAVGAGSRLGSASPRGPACHGLGNRIMVSSLYSWCHFHWFHRDSHSGDTWLWIKNSWNNSCHNKHNHW